MDEYYEIWNPPSNLIDKSKISAIPRHGIGRGFKVAKEEIAGLLVALRLFIEKDINAEMANCKKYLSIIDDKIKSLPNIETSINTPSNSEEYPTLNIHTGNIDAFELCNSLKIKSGLFLNEKGLSENFMTVHPMNLSDDNIEQISDVLHNDIKEYIK
jgi:L-seryl-tRNA(Ser) seleniumtransferase